jgi:hypothetical protein
MMNQRAFDHSRRLCVLCAFAAVMTSALAVPAGAHEGGRKKPPPPAAKRDLETARQSLDSAKK